MARIYSNFAKSTLASSIAAGDLSCTVAVGDGALFPAAGAGSTFDAVLYNTSGQREIVSCTSRTGDVLTIVRAQQGTIALAWNAGDRIGHRLTASALNALAFQQNIQEDTPVYCGTAGGTANALTLTPSTAITGYVVGQRFRFKALANSSGTVTVNVSAQGNKNVFLHYAALVGGEIVLDHFYEIVYDGTQFELIPLGDSARTPRLLTEDTAPDKIADFLGSYDASAATDKKLRLITALSAACPPGQGVLLNGKVVPSVGSNALTIAIKGDDGNDPSATNPVYVAFRSATAATGGFTIRSITSALSVVVSSGSTLGHASGKLCHLFAYLIDNGGTVELAVSNLPPDYPGVFADTRLISTTAEGGAGAADSATGIYSTTARSSLPWVCVAMMKSNQATAGTWATAIQQTDQAPFQIPRCSFAAHNSGGGTSTNINTAYTMQFPTELYDPDSTYDASTYRHQPNVAGEYQYEHLNTPAGSFAGASRLDVMISLNGGTLRGRTFSFAPAGGFPSGCPVARFFMNGTTDYVEATAQQTDSNPLTIGNANYGDSHFAGGRITGGR